MKLTMNEYKKLTTFIICLSELMSANAQKVTIDELKYYLFPDTYEAVIDNGNTWAGELEIPSEINYNGQTFTVSGIASLAFSDCTELTKVSFPKTLVNVIHHVLTDDPNIDGESSPDSMNPFEGCTALESIEVDENNPSMKSIGGVLFSKDGAGLYCYPAGIKADSYLVPDAVTWIGTGAFESNEYIMSVKMPSTVERLCASVFAGCKRLEDVKLPENLTHLEAYMFRNCKNLRSIEIPTGVKYIGEQVFYGCSSLKVIDLPESITFVGSISFMNCILDALVIRGILDSQSMNKDLFSGLNESAKVYVPASEIDRYMKIFTGNILPLEDFTTDIQDLSSSLDCLSPVFDLQGHRLSAIPQKGVYIQNGRKKLVK